MFIWPRGFGGFGGVWVKGLCGSGFRNYAV